MAESVMNEALVVVGIYSQNIGALMSFSAIHAIKKFLEFGLLARSLHPKDNFPKIVKAIANQTKDREEWAFSERAQRALHLLDAEEDVSVCCPMS